MTHTGDVETDCECQYTLMLADRVVQGEFSEMKDNFNHAPSIHEVDEDETDEDEVTAYEQPPLDPPEGRKTEEPRKEAPDDDFTYNGDSFYSDESYDESEEVSVVAERASRSASPVQVDDYKEDTGRKTTETVTSEEESEQTLREDEEQTVYTSNYTDRNLTLDEKSLSSRQVRNRRKNMSFTDEEMRKIERENQLLLRKIMAQQRSRDKILGNEAAQSRTSSSAINRKKLQKKIDYDNMLLLQRIQQAKSCVMKNASKPGCRLTFI